MEKFIAHRSSSIVNCLVVFLLLAINSYLLPITFAQDQGSEVTSVYEISDAQALDGDILVYGDQGLVRATLDSKKAFFGILQDDPVIVFRSQDEERKPVVRTGLAKVNVTSEGGPIKIGDHISLSNTPGKGQKADQSSLPIGIALEDFDQPSSTVGKITVAIQATPTISTGEGFGSIFSLIGLSFFENVKDPQKLGGLIRYMVAGLITLTSLIFSFVTFYRSVLRSIEAMGRNPLAKRIIFQSLLINAALMTVTVIVGVAASIIILRL